PCLSPPHPTHSPRPHHHSAERHPTLTQHHAPQQQLGSGNQADRFPTGPHSSGTSTSTISTCSTCSSSSNGDENRAAGTARHYGTRPHHEPRPGGAPSHLLCLRGKTDRRGYLGGSGLGRQRLQHHRGVYLLWDGHGHRAAVRAGVWGEEQPAR
ncbi:unnamed protein product, partial [Ectocarpus fasciculatus]